MYVVRFTKTIKGKVVSFMQELSIEDVRIRLDSIVLWVPLSSSSLRSLGFLPSVG